MVSGAVSCQRLRVGRRDCERTKGDTDTAVLFMPHPNLSDEVNRELRVNNGNQK